MRSLHYFSIMIRLILVDHSRAGSSIVLFFAVPGIGSCTDSYIWGWLSPVRHTFIWRVQLAYLTRLCEKIEDGANLRNPNFRGLVRRLALCIWQDLVAVLRTACPAVGDAALVIVKETSVACLAAISEFFNVAVFIREDPNAVTTACNVVPVNCTEILLRRRRCHWQFRRCAVAKLRLNFIRWGSRRRW